VKSTLFEDARSVLIPFKSFLSDERMLGWPGEKGDIALCEVFLADD
jgi:hypothetical protein